MGKFFTVEVTPTIPASAQHGGAMISNAVLFDWNAFQVPKGTCKLVNATILVRPKGDAGPTSNDGRIQLVFSKTNTQSLGTPDVAPLIRPSNDLLGVIEFEPNSYSSANLKGTSISNLHGGGGDTEAPSCPLIMTPSEITGNFNTLYLGGLTGDSGTDFQSINVINDGDINSTTPTAIVMAGSGMDVREHFIAGDVLHAQDDTLLGTVASIDDATTGPINLTSATSGAGDATTVTDGDTIYNIHPVRVILQFEV